MKAIYTAKITYFSLYDDLFDHVVFEELTLPKSTNDYVKQCFLNKISGRIDSELKEYDSFRIDIISEKDYNPLADKRKE